MTLTAAHRLRAPTLACVPDDLSRNPPGSSQANTTWTIDVDTTWIIIVYTPSCSVKHSEAIIMPTSECEPSAAQTIPTVNMVQTIYYA